MNIEIIHRRKYSSRDNQIQFTSSVKLGFDQKGLFGEWAVDAHRNQFNGLKLDFDSKEWSSGIAWMNQKANSIYLTVKLQFGFTSPLSVKTSFAFRLANDICFWVFWNYFYWYRLILVWKSKNRRSLQQSSAKQKAAADAWASLSLALRRWASRYTPE